MAITKRLGCGILANFVNSRSFLPLLNERRHLFLGSALSYPKTSAADVTASQLATDESKKESWLSKLLVRKIETGSESHSSKLSDKETVYELQLHSVKPEYMETYLKEFRTFVGMISSWNTGAELAGSWTVEVGDLDEAVHLWKFDHGYPALNRHKALLRTNQEFIDFKKSRNMMLRSRRNQILLAFSFWPEIQPRPGNNIYELRSYVLRPGTMIEWGNNWAAGLKFRSGENEAVGGFFSQVGELYAVHHLWAYESLQSRKDVREAAWSKPGWDDCVAHTVPLIRHMTSRILIPTPFSPLQ